MIKWDNTINTGTLIAMIPVVLILISVLRHMYRMEFKLDEIWDWFINNTERKLVIRSRSNDHK